MNLLPWLWLAAAYGITMGYLVLNGRPYVDSDMASEMVLADLLNQEGGLLSHSWGYSTELRIFYLQLLYRPALLLFPHNWYAARMLGQAGWMLVLILCVLFAGKGLGLQGGGVWAAAAMACPFGLWYFWYGAFGGFYVPHMVLLLLSFGLAVRLAEPKTGKAGTALWAILLLLVSFVNGLGSIKGIMAIYLPMAAAAVLLVCVQLHEAPEQLPRAGLRYLAAAAAALVSAGAGYAINSAVLTPQYSVINHNGNVWGELKLSNLLQNWCDFLSLLGFQNYNVDSLNISENRLFSVWGMLAALALLLVLAAILSIWCLVRRLSTANTKERILTITFLCICLVQGAIFSFIGDSVSNPSYWLTPLPMLILLMQQAWEKAPFRFRFSRGVCALAFAVCITGTSTASVHNFMTYPLRAVPELEPVADWLVENGYSYGFAAFWKANALTEWSNGELEMHQINIWELDPTDVKTWLEKLNRDTPPQGKVFLVCSAAELWDGHHESLRNEYNVYWDENDMMVMAFDSYEEMVQALAAAHADEEE